MACPGTSSCKLGRLVGQEEAGKEHRQLRKGLKTIHNSA